MATRVLVTGIGLVTPLGLTTPATWANLIAGKTAITHTPFHPSLPVSISAPIDRANLPPPPPLLSPCPPFATYALHAAQEALADANLLPSTADHPPPYDPHVAGVSIGVGMAHLPDIAQTSSLLERNAYRKVSPFFVPRILPNTPAGLVSLRHSLRGPSLAPATACAAGAHALADALYAIRRGAAHIMVAGGAEAAVNPIAVAGFARAKALAVSASSVPLDAARAGFVLGEGAAALVLESEEHARKRGAIAYAELAGAGMSGDAFHVTSPRPDGSGARAAMRAALADARMACSAVDYVSAHATGTRVGDAVERAAIARLLPADEVGAGAVVSATKAATGHLLGASGAVEAAFCALAVATGVVPPTRGLRALDDDAEVAALGWGDVRRYVPDVAVRKEVGLALSNSFGFGGTNACLAFTAVGNGVGVGRKRLR